MIKDREKLFLFVELDIENTNNRAERAVRPVVIAGKISGGSRSNSGAAMFEKLASVMRTMNLRISIYLQTE
ncbi:MAG: transposase [Thermoplasmata archaeon]|nr:transposase [Candidatus Sysuiplasma jiujiangense]MBX8643036.1 transposase [Candidatus Sysuiplasma jiujiangense]